MSHVDELNAILARYRFGEFGEELLSLHDILVKAGKPDLINQMSRKEVQQMIDSSSGFTKLLFLQIRRSKERQLTLRKERR